MCATAAATAAKALGALILAMLPPAVRPPRFHGWRILIKFISRPGFRISLPSSILRHPSCAGGSQTLPWAMLGYRRRPFNLSPLQGRRRTTRGAANTFLPIGSALLRVPIPAQSFAALRSTCRVPRCPSWSFGTICLALRLIRSWLRPAPWGVMFGYALARFPAMQPSSRSSRALGSSRFTP